MSKYKKFLKIGLGIFVIVFLISYNTKVFALPRCGDGIINKSFWGQEQCDDGNKKKGDGCNSFCQLEIPTCDINVNIDEGNAPFNVTAQGVSNKNWGDIIDISFGDGNNTINKTGNKQTFSSENTYTYGGKYNVRATVQNNLTPIRIGTVRPTANCETEVKVNASCGDGELNQASEQCDDGNNENGDGCSYNCQLEVPTCKIDLSKNKGSAPLNTTITLKKDFSWSNFIELSYGDSTTPLTTGIGETINHTYNACNTSPCLITAKIKSSYSGKKQDGLELPEGQCGSSVGTFNYEEVDSKLRAEIAFIGTCFGKEPVMVIRGIDNINNLDDPKLDRRYFNNFKFQTAYSGCYSVKNMKVSAILLDGKRQDSDPIPDDTSMTPPRVLETNFSNADMVNEDRISNPLEKDLEMNIGYKHHRNDSINGDYTTLQEKINDIYPFEGDNGQVSLKLVDNRDQEYTTNLIDKTLYPYCYVFPKLKLIGSDGRNEKDLTFKYLGCDPLEKITIDFHLDQYDGEENKKTGTKKYTYQDPADPSFDRNKNISDKTNGSVCIENDLDGDGIMCNSSVDNNAIGAFEDFTLTLDLPNEMMTDFLKGDFLTNYIDGIIKNSNDLGKDIFLSLYNEILGKEPRINTTTGDYDPSNDTKPSSHNIIGFKSYFDLPYKPGININEFKVIFAKIDEKEFIQQNGLLKINYDNIDIVDPYHAKEYKPYGIIKVFDPYGNEIELMGKRIDFVPDQSYNKNDKKNIIQYIPMIMDNTYPDGIYTVKMEIFDKFDKKIDKDQYTSFFKNNSVPQISSYLKEKGKNVPNKLGLVENFNNGYLIDLVDYISNKSAFLRVFLHKPVYELKKTKANGTTSIIFKMNNSNIYVPLAEIKKDEITGLEYVDIEVKKDPVKDLEGKLIGNGINTIELVDIYGEGNWSKNTFNVLLAEGTTARKPSLEEDYMDYTLKIKNIFTVSTDIPVVNGIKEGIQADKINFFNNNLWFKIGNDLYVKDFSNNIVSVIDAEGWSKIKMKNSGIIRTKANSMNIVGDATVMTLPSAIVMDYDIENNLGFAIKDNGKVFTFNKNGYINSTEEIFKFDAQGEENIQAISLYYIPTNNSYEIFVIVNGTLYILNYNVENGIISKDYGPIDEGYTNSLLVKDIIDLDIKEGFEKLNIFVLKNTPDRNVKLISLPFIKYKDAYVKDGMPINFYINSTIPMSYYKKKILPRVQLSHKEDIVTEEEYMQMIIDVNNKKQNTIRVYLAFGANNISDNGVIQSDNFAGFDKYEIYSDGNKVADKDLITKNEKGGQAVEVSVPFNGKTNTYVVKGINKKFGSPVSTVVPVINYLFSFNMSGLEGDHVEVTNNDGEKILEPILYDDGKYSDITLSFFDKRGNQIRSYNNQEILIINNKVYSYIPIYMNKISTTGAGEINYFDFLNGGHIELLFNYKGKVLKFNVPFSNKLLSKFSMFSKELINKKGETIDFNNLVEKKSVTMLEDYIRGTVKEFVNTKNFVEKRFVDKVTNWDLKNYDQLMICIKPKDSEDLRYKLKEIYPILATDLQKIAKNKLNNKEYLQKRFEEKIRWLKTTKLQSTDICIHLEDLIE